LGRSSSYLHSVTSDKFRGTTYPHNNVYPHSCFTASMSHQTNPILVENKAKIDKKVHTAPKSSSKLSWIRSHSYITALMGHQMNYTLVKSVAPRGSKNTQKEGAYNCQR